VSTYRTSFQCPETGQMVIARYAFGKVTLEAAADDDVFEKMLASGDSTPEAIAETQAATRAYCARHTNKRISSLEEADQYIVTVSDGQTFGFEKG
jgi:hypothetical protein